MTSFNKWTNDNLQLEWYWVLALAAHYILCGVLGIVCVKQLCREKHHPLWTTLSQQGKPPPRIPYVFHRITLILCCIFLLHGLVFLPSQSYDGAITVFHDLSTRTSAVLIEFGGVVYVTQVLLNAFASAGTGNWRESPYAKCISKTKPTFMCLAVVLEYGWVIVQIATDSSWWQIGSIFSTASLVLMLCVVTLAGVWSLRVSLQKHHNTGEAGRVSRSEYAVKSMARKSSPDNKKSGGGGFVGFRSPKAKAANNRAFEPALRDARKHGATMRRLRRVACAVTAVSALSWAGGAVSFLHIWNASRPIPYFNGMDEDLRFSSVLFAWARQLWLIAFVWVGWTSAPPKECNSPHNNQNIQSARRSNVGNRAAAGATSASATTTASGKSEGLPAETAGSEPRGDDVPAERGSKGQQRRWREEKAAGGGEQVLEMAAIGPIIPFDTGTDDEAEQAVVAGVDEVGGGFSLGAEGDKKRASRFNFLRLGSGKLGNIMDKITSAKTPSRASVTPESGSQASSLAALDRKASNLTPVHSRANSVFAQPSPTTPATPASPFSSRPGSPSPNGHSAPFSSGSAPPPPNGVGGFGISTAHSRTLSTDGSVPALPSIDYVATQGAAGDYL